MDEEEVEEEEEDEVVVPVDPRTLEYLSISSLAPGVIITSYEWPGPCPCKETVAGSSV